MGLFDFSLIRKSVQSLEGRLKDLRIEMNDLQRQRGQILSAPMCRADIKAYLIDWVTKASFGYTDNFRAGISRLAKSPRGLMPAFDGNGPAAIRLLGAAQNFGETPSAMDMDRALCGLFGPQLVDFLTDLVDTMEWPGEGLPMAQRPAAVEKLDLRIGELMQEEAALIDQAREAGIALS